MTAEEGEGNDEFQYLSAAAHIDLLPPCSRNSAQLQLRAKGAYKVEEIPEPETNEWGVYLLREKTDGPCSYVGHTGRHGKLPEERLADHNETNEKGGGANETRGTQWKICRVFYGFADESIATSFEETISVNEVECWQQRLPIIESIRSLDKWQWVQEDQDYTDDDIWPTILERR